MLHKAKRCRQPAYVVPALQLIAMHVGEAKLDLPTLHDNVGRLSKRFVCNRRTIQYTYLQECLL